MICPTCGGVQLTERPHAHTREEIAEEQRKEFRDALRIIEAIHSAETGNGPPTRIEQEGRGKGGHVHWNAMIHCRREYDDCSLTGA
jgi:hypothetical protein